MATIKEVASLARVSVATVSRVMNGSDNVLAATRQKVLEAIEELSYSPNLLGRNLRRCETKKILVLLNTISNQFYSHVVKGIEEHAQKNGYTVLLCMTHGKPETEKLYLGMVKTKLVDGAIMLTTEQDGKTLTKEYMNENIVQACEPCREFKTSTVSIDNEKAAYDAVNYLIGKGHREIAFFGADSIYQSSIQRRVGYENALLKNGIEPDAGLCFSEGFGATAGERAAAALLKRERLPDAIFCVSDSSAAGAIKELSRCGVTVPNDISVMGFDNTRLAGVYTPSITTLRQPQYEIGKEACILLLKRIDGGIETLPIDISLMHDIIERDSVRQR